MGWFDIQWRVRIRTSYWILRCAQNHTFVVSSLNGTRQRALASFDVQNRCRMLNSIFCGFRPFLRRPLSVIRRIPILPHRFVALRAKECGDFLWTALVVDRELLERIGRARVAA